MINSEHYPCECVRERKKFARKRERERERREIGRKGRERKLPNFMTLMLIMFEREG